MRGGRRRRTFGNPPAILIDSMGTYLIFNAPSMLSTSIGRALRRIDRGQEGSTHENTANGAEATLPARHFLSSFLLQRLFAPVVYAPQFQSLQLRDFLSCSHCSERMVRFQRPLLEDCGGVGRRARRALT